MRAILAFCLCALATPALADAQPSPAPIEASLTDAARRLVPVLNDEAAPDSLFNSAFLAAVPPAQLKAVTAQLRSAHGQAVSVRSIVPMGPNLARVTIAYERADQHFDMALDPAAPRLVAQLVTAGNAIAGDSLQALTTELGALPGSTSMLVARLDGDAPHLAAGHEADRPLAIGSTFKLFLLAELVRQVKAGERRWTDVVTLDRKSLTSDRDHWPAGAPLTLHSLAALMISRSDNSATDTLLHLLGREKVETILPALGLSAQAAARNRPFLSTREAFVLKTAPDLLAPWIAADEAGRRALLAGPVAAVSADAVDLSRFTGAPLAIDSVEWFASANDLARTMLWLVRSGDPQVMAILAINPGFNRAVFEGWDYVGFKGGSEAGVINFTYLLRDPAGRYTVTTLGWNDPRAAIDGDKAASVNARLVALAKP